MSRFTPAEAAAVALLALLALGAGCKRTPEGPSPGELELSDGRLLYGAAGGALELCEVHPAGKRPMDAEAWIRGYGARLAGSR